jgi:hypothetical protein
VLQQENPKNTYTSPHIHHHPTWAFLPPSLPMQHMSLELQHLLLPPPLLLLRSH